MDKARPHHLSKTGTDPEPSNLKVPKDSEHLRKWSRLCKEFRIKEDVSLQ